MSGVAGPLYFWRIDPKGRTSATANIVLWLIPFAVFAAVYHRGLHAWWMNDDSAILLSVIQSGTLPHFYRPLADFGQLPSNLTPWLYASYGIDFMIGALDPRGAYVHHFVSWAALLAALTVVLRRWLHSAVAAVVLVWFILAVPTSTVVELLCTRHYVEGLLVAALSVLAYMAYWRRGQGWYLLLSAMLYATATLAKEVFVPLGPLLVLHYALFAKPVAKGTGASQRVLQACIALWPHVAVAGIYVIYRGYMLGFDHLFSGYGVPEWQTKPAMLLDLPATWESTFRWPHWQTAGWLALICSGVAFWYGGSTWSQRWRGTLFGLAIAVALLAPIYPVLGILTVYRWNWHYLVIPGLAFFVLAGWASQRCAEALAARNREVGGGTAKRASQRAVAVVVVLVLLTAAQFRSARLAAWPWHKDDHVERYRVEGTYELYSPDQSLIIDAIGQSTHHIGLQEIRRILLRLPDGPKACAPGDCNSAVARQRESGGACVRYRSAPPRLEQVSCTPDAAGNGNGAK